MKKNHCHNSIDNLNSEKLSFDCFLGCKTQYGHFIGNMDTLLVIFWFLALKTLTYWSLELFSPEDVIFSGVVACCSEVSILLIESVSISICYRIMFLCVLSFFSIWKADTGRYQCFMGNVNNQWRKVSTKSGQAVHTSHNWKQPWGKTHFLYMHIISFNSIRH